MENFEEISDILQASGYNGGNGGLFFKGYSIENGYGEKSFNVHVRAEGEILQVLFRDYLNSHSEQAAEYEALKESFAKNYSQERNMYTLFKRRFVEDVNTLAIMELIKKDPEEAKKIPPYLFPISEAQWFESAKTGEPIKDWFGRSTGLVMKVMNQDKR